ncbi:hypothetical protein [Paenibacillus algorifonticola]|uniref:hypothetical protein n=1 Tax=Paenibacillus algorifonticola TaxID=684063 RepID=UPI001160AA63|nr:hypothetical protein [Paenibacillus algorifonticola]
MSSSALIFIPPLLFKMLLRSGFSSSSGLKLRSHFICMRRLCPICPCQQRITAVNETRDSFERIQQSIDAGKISEVIASVAAMSQQSTASTEEIGLDGSWIKAAHSPSHHSSMVCGLILGS